MEDFDIRKTEKKGYGVFALRGFRRAEHIFHVDLTKLEKYTLKELMENPRPDDEHEDYVGHGKYVIDHSPASYMNHSCDPNCYVKMKTIAVKDAYALRDIKKGEELTHDYTATSVDQFDGKGFWIDECKCDSKNCRKIMQEDLFKLPESLQKKDYPNLPPSIKRKHREHFKRLKQK